MSAELRRWLWAIRGAAPPDWFLEVRHTREGSGMGRVFHPVGQVDEAARTVARLGQRCDTYVSVLPRVRRSGTADDVSVGHVVWVDLDRPGAVEAAQAFPISPSMTLSSGNGQHRYWVLDRPTPAAEIVEANQRLAAHLGGDPACTDAARIMRAPGTLNLKNRENPRPCRVIETTPDTWSLADLLAEVPPLPVKPVKVKPLPIGTADDPIKRVPPPVYFAALTGLEPGRDGMVSCPLHDDRTPSCRIYDEPDRGWWCFGCQAGGDVYDLAARLWSVPTTGRAFIELRQRIAAALIGGSHD